MTVTTRRLNPLLAALLVVELAFIYNFWPVFMRLGANVYVFLDRHVADCALSGCPKIPLW